MTDRRAHVAATLNAMGDELEHAARAFARDLERAIHSLATPDGRPVRLEGWQRELLAGGQLLRHAPARRPPSLGDILAGTTAARGAGGQS